MNHKNAIKIIDRQIYIPSNQKNIGVVGDNSTEVRIFELARYYDMGDETMLDLSEYKPYICIATSTLTDDKLPLSAEDDEIEITDQYIYLKWNIKRKHVYSDERVYVKIQFEKTVQVTVYDKETETDIQQDEINTWQTFVNFFEVLPTIYVDENIANQNATIIQDHENRITNLEQTPPSATSIFWNKH